MCSVIRVLPPPPPTSPSATSVFLKQVRFDRVESWRKKTREISTDLILLASESFYESNNVGFNFENQYSDPFARHYNSMSSAAPSSGISLLARMWQQRRGNLSSTTTGLVRTACQDEDEISIECPRGAGIHILSAAYGRSDWWT